MMMMPGMGMGMGMPMNMGMGMMGMGMMGMGMGMDSSDNGKKFFVGGFPEHTTQKDIKKYFEQYGTVEEVTIMIDQETQRPKGFGFITYADADHKLEVPGNHVINGKRVNVNVAVRKTSVEPAVTKEPCKIYVGGLSPASTKESIQRFFSAFGFVKDVTLKGVDGADPRGSYCFIEFDSSEAASAATSEQYRELDGKQVEVKSAKRKMAMDPTGGFGGIGAMHGGMRGTRPSPYPQRGGAMAGAGDPSQAFGGGYGMYTAEQLQQAYSQYPGYAQQLQQYAQQLQQCNQAGAQFGGQFPQQQFGQQGYPQQQFGGQFGGDQGMMMQQNPGAGGPQM